MDHQNIDRLFREKLGGMETPPSADAWSRVEKQIGTSKKPMIYWVAASVALLLCAALVMWPTKSQTYLASEIDHPMLEIETNLVAPVAVQLKAETSIMENRKNSVKSQPTITNTQYAKTDDNNEGELVLEETPELPEVSAKTMVASEEIEVDLTEITSPDKIEVSQEELSAVKITYIASSKNEKITLPETKNDTTSTLKKFIAFAENIDPGEMLADMKTAKDNLLNGGFKNKKDRSTMTP